VDKRMIAFFEELAIEDVSTVGGKCASLGEMSKIGVPVPPGFAVTTEAFDYFLRETGAFDELEKSLTGFSEEPSTIDEFNEMEKAFQKIILAKTLPTEIDNAVSKAYETLCDRYKIKDMPVAVRSSGVAEDSPTASFAGQYESYLNVIGNEEVLEKLLECWASMYTARGISYRLKQGMPILEGGMSVAVMKMVNSKASGVAFTLLPSKQDTSKMFVEGNYGVGESVVQGIVNPDQFIIDKKTLQVETKIINRKLRQYSMKEYGTEEEDVPAELQNVCCINDDEVSALAKYFKFIDTHYEVPMDIEWAIDNDLPFPQNVFLVQARPVTIKAKEKPAAELLMDIFLDFSRDGLKDKNILVVDDETDILETVAELLDTSQVHKAVDYDTALQSLEKNTYDIVVLDIMGVKGLELLKTSVERGFPTVMFTAHALTSDALAKSVDLGAAGFIPKEKVMKLKEVLEIALLEDGRAAWKEIFDQFEPLFNKKFGFDWKKEIAFPENG
jgi:phosphoenolpyruvate synthase/pyruvate phosphate dikinase